MAGSLNKVSLIGTLGKDPEVRTMQNGGSVCNLSVATSETWKDKATGEKKEKTEWHRVTIWNDGLVKVCQNYLKKGSKVYLEGSLETRKWTDQGGNDRYSTEIVLKAYNGQLIMLSGKPPEGGQQAPQQNAAPDNTQQHGAADSTGRSGTWQPPKEPTGNEFDDDIPL